MQLVYENIEYCVASFVIFSLSIYLFFAYFEYKKTGSFDNSTFIDNIILFSFFWIEMCITIAYFSLSKFIITSVLVTNIKIFLASCFVVVFIVSFYVVKKRYYKKKTNKLLIYVSYLISISCVVLSYIFDLSYKNIFYLCLSIYVFLSLVFTFFIMKSKRSFSKIGFIYVVLGSILIFLNSFFISNLNSNLCFNLNLILSLLLLLGIIIYYCEINSLSINEKILSLKDNSEKLTNAEMKILKLAFNDQITGLGNSNQLQNDISLKSFKNTFMLMINIENFKNINSFLGYKEGNKVLKHFSSDLKKYALENTIYRIYSDKFVVLHDGDKESCIELAKNIVNIFTEKTYSMITLHCYIGITYVGEEKKDYDTFIKELELASQAANQKQFIFEFYNDNLFDEFQQKVSLENNLRKAVSENNWEIYFQPKVSVTNNQVIGAEALIRWKDNISISPAVFIPLSEQLGLIKDIGRFVIEKSFEYISIISNKTKNRINISINLSPYQLMEVDFIDFVSQKLSLYSIDPTLVTFEITESAVINNISKVNDTIKKLKEIGFYFSLDDFGTGYSSLAYFSKLLLDEVKFDRGFTSSLPKDEKNIIILNSISKMAKNLGIHIIVEGVENEEQYNCIKDIGCDNYQGYYFSKPIPLFDFLEMLK